MKCVSFLIIKMLHEIFDFLVPFVNTYFGLSGATDTPIKCGMSVRVYLDGKKIKSETLGDSGSMFEEKAFGCRIVCSKSSNVPYSKPLTGLLVVPNSSVQSEKFDFDEDDIAAMHSLLTSDITSNFPLLLTSLKTLGNSIH